MRITAKMDLTASTWFNVDAVDELREMIIVSAQQKRSVFDTEEFIEIWAMCSDFGQFYEDNFEESCKIKATSLFSNESFEAQSKIENHYTELITLVCIYQHGFGNAIVSDILSPGVCNFMAGKGRAAPLVLPVDNSETYCADDYIEIIEDGHLMSQCDDETGTNVFSNVENATLNEDSDGVMYNASCACIAAEAAPPRPALGSNTVPLRPGLPNLEVIASSTARELDMKEESHSCEDNLDTYELDIFADVQNVEIVIVQVSSNVSGKFGQRGAGVGAAHEASDTTSYTPLPPPPSPQLPWHPESYEICTEITANYVGDGPRNKRGLSVEADKVLISGAEDIGELAIGIRVAAVCVVPGYSPPPSPPPPPYSHSLARPGGSPTSSKNASEMPDGDASTEICDEVFTEEITLYNDSFDKNERDSSTVAQNVGSESQFLKCVDSVIIVVKECRVGSAVVIRPQHVPDDQPPQPPLPLPFPFSSSEERNGHYGTVSQNQLWTKQPIRLPDHHIMEKCDYISFPFDVKSLCIKENRVEMDQNVACIDQGINDQKDLVIIRSKAKPPDVISLPTNAPVTEFASTIISLADHHGNESTNLIYEDMNYVPGFCYEEKSFERLGYVHTMAIVEAATKISSRNGFRREFFSPDFMPFSSMFAAEAGYYMHFAKMLGFNKDLQESESKSNLQETEPNEPGVWARNFFTEPHGGRKNAMLNEYWRHKMKIISKWMLLV